MCLIMKSKCGIEHVQYVRRNNMILEEAKKAILEVCEEHGVWLAIGYDNFGVCIKVVNLAGCIELHNEEKEK